MLAFAFTAPSPPLLLLRGATWLGTRNPARIIGRKLVRKGMRSYSLSSSVSASCDAVTEQDVEPVAYPGFGFEILHRADGSGDAIAAAPLVPSAGPQIKSNARLGLLRTPHGDIETPAFIFCATKAGIRGVGVEDMRREGTQVMLSNTFHLMLSPGAELVQRMGGLHHFMRYSGPMLTDSGGYQIFSMGHGSVSDEIKGRRNAKQEPATTSSKQQSNHSALASSIGTKGPLRPPPPPPAAPPAAAPSTLLGLSEMGASFRSYVNGAELTLTPEASVDIQRRLGADLIVVLDECTPFHAHPAYTELSMNRSHRWALRSLREFKRGHDGSQALYGIIQGGVYRTLRDMSVDFVRSLPFFGIAIGGSLGADVPSMHRVVEYTRRKLGDTPRPVHLLGIGGIKDIFHGVRCGIDTFDCVHPTRIARHGRALVRPAQTPYTTSTPNAASSTGDGGDASNNSEIPRVSDDIVVMLENKLGVVRAKLEALERVQAQQWAAVRARMEAAGPQVLEAARSPSFDIKGKFCVETTMQAFSDKARNRLVGSLSSLEGKIATRLREVGMGEPQIERYVHTVLRKHYQSLIDEKTGTEGAVNKSTTSVSAASSEGREFITLTRSTMREDERPIDETCGCYTCTGRHQSIDASTASAAALPQGRHYSRSYLHHLFKTDNSLAGTLVTIHNVHFMNRMMSDIRAGIREGRLEEVAEAYGAAQEPGNDVTYKNP